MPKFLNNTEKLSKNLSTYIIMHIKKLEIKY